MKRLATPLFCAALALFSYFVIPGHTWLQQDSQIYVPILEHERDPSVLRNDILVQRSHVAYTLYDEAAVMLRTVTGLGFHEVLAIEQIVTRALGIWGLMMLAESLGLVWWKAAVAAALCSLGARIAGPEVLTMEYEPTPRAFAVPLLVCAMGLAARGRWLASGIATGAAVLYHVPTALPVIAAGLLAMRRGRLVWVACVAAAFALVIAAGHGGGQDLFARIPPPQESLQRMRAAYVYVSMWGWGTVLNHILMFAVLAWACLLLRRMYWLVLPAMGILSMPISWLLLEQWKLGLIPQIQPMRALLFVRLGLQLTAACLALTVKRRVEAGAWMLIAILLPMPALIARYPNLHTADIEQLSGWARANTLKDAVFLFADSGKSLAPGVFRSEALRAVYADWKGGGQVNYLREFGDDWWFRWQQTVGRGFHPEDLPRYSALGIRYVVLRKRMEAAPVYENGGYSVYALP